jgi:hypothetical protein
VLTWHDVLSEVLPVLGRAGIGRLLLLAVLQDCGALSPCMLTLLLLGL